MSTLLPKDDDNNTIPAMRFKNGGAHAISATAASARNGTAFNAATRVIGLYATGPVYLKFGGSAVTATTADHFFPGSVYYDIAISGGKGPLHTHLAVLAAGSNCTVYISEKE